MNQALNTEWMDMAAGRGGLAAGVIVAGVVVVAVLIGAFWLGSRVRRRESRPPTPEEQPKMPEGGPVREVRETREPNEMPRSDTRLTPHELHNEGSSPTRTGPAGERPRWDGGGSGSFGSGGPGGS
ncbi:MULTISPECIES: DUF6479 family protein [unclassified Streptomyces]|uniref:DUF6479 family protein n=1 Tax=unclassified Streptomyces TaxID=2593676 RepID=UPI000F4EE8A5|nr:MULTISPECIES: DUF6479 family protein [unclassified Streptomyces]MDH6501737.1 hypothetical protein [Streptomyces sp. SAI-149]QUC59846.1 hypothetical protein IOD14_25540 [Streptomyces sp. A2-16]